MCSIQGFKRIHQWVQSDKYTGKYIWVVELKQKRIHTKDHAYIGVNILSCWRHTVPNILLELLFIEVNFPFPV